MEKPNEACWGESAARLAERYAPVLYLDEAEPFAPVRVGVSLLRPGDRSPSFKRTFRSSAGSDVTIIEYAIYWDYDIGHLYELEHVWVYVDGSGRVTDCESSFHGKFLRTLLRDGGNLEDGTHVRLYAQPGKHAFMPSPQHFDLVPGLVESCGAEAGADGLTVNDMLSGRIRSNAEINRIVSDYLRSVAFVPAMRFRRCTLEPALFTSWPGLLEEIPARIEGCLKALGYEGQIYI